MASQTRLLVEQVDGVTILSLNPQLKLIDEAVIPQLSEKLLAAIEVQPPLIVLDLNGTEFFSSSFIEVLFRMWNRLKQKSGRFALCNLHPYCRQVLEITNLHRVWPLARSRTEAIAALQASEANQADPVH